MTLNTNEIVYTADLMNISPANDAQIYGKGGNYILSGLEIRAVTSTSATLTAGRALIQGRLFELKANTQYTLTAGTSQYLGLEIDLTKENTDDGAGNITNNQFTVKSNDREYGDTRLGDIQSFVAFYQISINGASVSTTQLIWKYIETAKLHPGNVFSDYSTGQATYAKRVGTQVTIRGAVTNSQSVDFGGGLGAVQLPESMRPRTGLHVYLSQGSEYARFLITIDGSGWLMFSRYSSNGNQLNVQKNAWLNISTSFDVM